MSQRGKRPNRFDNDDAAASTSAPAQKRRKGRTPASTSSTGSSKHSAPSAANSAAAAGGAAHEQQQSKSSTTSAHQHATHPAGASASAGGAPMAHGRLDGGTTQQQQYSQQSHHHQHQHHNQQSHHQPQQHQQQQQQPHHHHHHDDEGGGHGGGSSGSNAKAAAAAAAAAAASNVAAWQPRNDIKSSIYNRSAPEAPAELFRKDLISAMKLPDSEPLAQDEYWTISDQWKQEWERGVQVPVNPDSLPEPSVSAKRPDVSALAVAGSRQDFKLPKNKFIRITKDDSFSADLHYLSNTPAKAEAACAYDLDQCDEAWLRVMNGERAMVGAGPVSEEQFERVVEELEVRCWDKIQAIMKSEEGLGIEYDENVICDVCRSPDSEEANEMVFCDSCNICVHQACYGITTIPSGSWMCRTCSMGKRPDCVLCPNMGGAMKSTRSGQKWAHVSCALWIPEVSIGSVDRMEPITKISSIPPSRWALICVLCRERVGACIQCSVKTCKTAYHVTCAFQHGLEMRAIIEDENAEDGVKLRSYCLKHSMNKNKKEKCNALATTNGGGSGSDDDDNKRKKHRKDMTTEERNMARQKRQQEIESEFDKHVNVRDISCHLLEVDQDAIHYIHNYWILKRKSLQNKSLLPARADDADAAAACKQEPADIEKMKMFVHLRQDLERVRNLCYMVSRREKLSRSFFKIREQTFYNQVAVLDACGGAGAAKRLSEKELAAVLQANHAPDSVYDRLYSSEKCWSSSGVAMAQSLEQLMARLLGAEVKEEVPTAMTTTTSATTTGSASKAAANKSTATTSSSGNKKSTSTELNGMTKKSKKRATSQSSDVHGTPTTTKNKSAYMNGVATTTTSSGSARPTTTSTSAKSRAARSIYGSSLSSDDDSDDLDMARRTARLRSSSTSDNGAAKTPATAIMVTPRSNISKSRLPASAASTALMTTPTTASRKKMSAAQRSLLTASGKSTASTPGVSESKPITTTPSSAATDRRKRRTSSSTGSKQTPRTSNASKFAQLLDSSSSSSSSNSSNSTTSSSSSSEDERTTRPAAENNGDKSGSSAVSATSPDKRSPRNHLLRKMERELDKYRVSGTESDDLMPIRGAGSGSGAPAPSAHSGAHSQTGGAQRSGSSVSGSHGDLNSGSGSAKKLLAAANIYSDSDSTNDKDRMDNTASDSQQHPFRTKAAMKEFNMAAATSAGGDASSTPAKPLQPTMSSATARIPTPLERLEERTKSPSYSSTDRSALTAALVTASTSNPSTFTEKALQDNERAPRDKVPKERLDHDRKDKSHTETEDAPSPPTNNNRQKPSTASAAASVDKHNAKSAKGFPPTDLLVVPQRKAAKKASENMMRTTSSSSSSAASLSSSTQSLSAAAEKSAARSLKEAKEQQQRDEREERENAKKDTSSGSTTTTTKDMTSGDRVDTTPKAGKGSSPKVLTDVRATKPRGRPSNSSKFAAAAEAAAQALLNQQQQQQKKITSPPPATIAIKDAHAVTAAQVTVPILAPAASASTTTDTSKKMNNRVDKELIVAYVPQRQAAKKAAEHIKSGLGKPTAAPDASTSTPSSAPSTNASSTNTSSDEKLTNSKSTTAAQKKDTAQKATKPAVVLSTSATSSSGSDSSSNSSSGSSSSSSSGSDSDDDNNASTPKVVSKADVAATEQPAKELPVLLKANQRNRSASSDDDSSSSDSDSNSSGSSSSSSGDDVPTKPVPKVVNHATNNKKSTPAQQQQQTSPKKPRKEPEKKLKTSELESSAVKGATAASSTIVSPTKPARPVGRAAKRPSISVDRRRSIDLRGGNLARNAAAAAGNKTAAAVVSPDKPAVVEPTKSNSSSPTKRASSKRKSSVFVDDNRSARADNKNKQQQVSTSAIVDPVSAVNATDMSKKPADTTTAIVDGGAHEARSQPGELSPAQRQAHERLNNTNSQTDVVTPAVDTAASLEQEISERKAQTSAGSAISHSSSVNNHHNRLNKSSGSLDKLLSRRERDVQQKAAAAVEQTPSSGSPVKETHTMQQKMDEDEVKVVLPKTSAASDVIEIMDEDSKEDDLKASIQPSSCIVSTVVENAEVPAAIQPDEPVEQKLNLNTIPPSNHDQSADFSFGTDDGDKPIIPIKSPPADIEATNSENIEHPQTLVDADMQQSMFSPRATTMPIEKSDDHAAAGDIFNFDQDFAGADDAFMMGSGDMSATSVPLSFNFPTDNLFKQDFKEDSAKETMDLVGKLRQKFKKTSTSAAPAADSLVDSANATASEPQIIDLDSSPEGSGQAADKTGSAPTNDSSMPMSCNATEEQTATIPDNSVAMELVEHQTNSNTNKDMPSSANQQNCTNLLEQPPQWTPTPTHPSGVADAASVHQPSPAEGCSMQPATPIDHMQHHQHPNTPSDMQQSINVNQMHAHVATAVPDATHAHDSNSPTVSAAHTDPTAAEPIFSEELHNTIANKLMNLHDPSASSLADMTADMAHDFLKQMGPDKALLEHHLTALMQKKLLPHPAAVDAAMPTPGANNNMSHSMEEQLQSQQQQQQYPVLQQQQHQQQQLLHNQHQLHQHSQQQQQHNDTSGSMLPTVAIRHHVVRDIGDENDHSPHRMRTANTWQDNEMIQTRRSVSTSPSSASEANEPTDRINNTDGMAQHGMQRHQQHQQHQQQQHMHMQQHLQQQQYQQFLQHHDQLPAHMQQQHPAMLPFGHHMQQAHSLQQAHLRKQISDMAFSSMQHTQHHLPHQHQQHPADMQVFGNSTAQNHTAADASQHQQQQQQTPLSAIVGDPMNTFNNAYNNAAATGPTVDGSSNVPFNASNSNAANVAAGPVSLFPPTGTGAHNAQLPFPSPGAAMFPPPCFNNSQNFGSSGSLPNNSTASTTTTAASAVEATAAASATAATNNAMQHPHHMQPHLSHHQQQQQQLQSSHSPLVSAKLDDHHHHHQHHQHHPQHQQHQQSQQHQQQAIVGQLTYPANPCGAAFTSSSHNMALTEAIVAPQNSALLSTVAMLENNNIHHHHQPAISSNHNQDSIASATASGNVGSLLTAQQQLQSPTPSTFLSPGSAQEQNAEAAAMIAAAKDLIAAERARKTPAHPSPSPLASPSPSKSSLPSPATSVSAHSSANATPTVNPNKRATRVVAQQAAQNISQQLANTSPSGRSPPGRSPHEDAAYGPPTNSGRGRGRGRISAAAAAAAHLQQSSVAGIGDETAGGVTAATAAPTRGAGRKNAARGTGTRGRPRGSRGRGRGSTAPVSPAMSHASMAAAMQHPSHLAHSLVHHHQTGGVGGGHPHHSLQSHGIHGMPHHAGAHHPHAHLHHQMGQLHQHPHHPHLHPNIAPAAMGGGGVDGVGGGHEYDFMRGTMHNKLAGTAYDLDLDEDFAGGSVENLKSMRDRRRSIDCRQDQFRSAARADARDATAQSPNKFASPGATGAHHHHNHNHHLKAGGRMFNATDLRPPTPVRRDSLGNATNANNSVNNTTPSQQQSHLASPVNSAMHSIVSPVLPGPVDMRTYNSGYDSGAYNNSLLINFASGTADQTLPEIDEEMEKELQSALKASNTKPKGATTPASAATATLDTAASAHPSAGSSTGLLVDQQQHHPSNMALADVNALLNPLAGSMPGLLNNNNASAITQPAMAHIGGHPAVAAALTGINATGVAIHNASGSSLVDVPGEDVSVDSVDSNLQSKLKGIKGPDGYTATSVPTSAQHQHTAAETPLAPMPNAGVMPPSNPSNLRRMRKKELLRQYCTQDMNQDAADPSVAAQMAGVGSEHVAPAYHHAYAMGATSRSGGIPKAVDSMSSLPTKDDYKDYAASADYHHHLHQHHHNMHHNHQHYQHQQSLQQRQKPRLPRELRLLDIPYDAAAEAIGERRRSVGSNASSGNSTNASTADAASVLAGVSTGSTSAAAAAASSSKRMTRTKQQAATMATPKLKIKIGGQNAAEVTQMSSSMSAASARPPKKRLSNMPTPSLEDLKRESMNFRKQMMGEFDKDDRVRAKKAKASKSEKKEEKKEEKRLRKLEKKLLKMTTVVQTVDASVAAVAPPKLIIRIGKRKAGDETEADTDKQTTENAVSDAPINTKNVSANHQSPTPIRLKIARSSHGSTYVAAIGDKRPATSGGDTDGSSSKRSKSSPIDERSTNAVPEPAATISASNLSQSPVAAVGTAAAYTGGLNLINHHYQHQYQPPLQLPLTNYQPTNSHGMLGNAFDNSLSASAASLLLPPLPAAAYSAKSTSSSPLSLVTGAMHVPAAADGHGSAALAAIAAATVMLSNHNATTTDASSPVDAIVCNSVGDTNVYGDGNASVACTTPSTTTATSTTSCPTPLPLSKDCEVR